ncbi:hypothetical protein [Carboxylicivirga taeanensis]|uniref:hypothetical protein n=1 Tax=Carboxylicivirga taeanensis TaxID=1416875 RepID=UPI003F6DCA05
MSRFILNTLLTIFLLSWGTIRLYSQDANRWSQQYGTRSILLSNSIIGGVNDLSAVYYNPARIAQLEEKGVVISANVYEWYSLSIDNAFGDNKKLSNSDFRGVPSLAAGTFYVPFLKKHYFAWAILNRQNSSNHFSYRDQFYGNVITEIPGQEYFGADVQLASNEKEDWAGVSWAYNINEHLSIGSSIYLSVLKSSKNLLINMQALSDADQSAFYRYRKQYSLEHYSGLLKVALSYRNEKYNVGLTLKTPSIRLTGTGDYIFEEYSSGIVDSNLDKKVYLSGFQNDLKTNHISPLAIGFGVSRKVGKNSLHFSAEYYQGVPKYTLMESESFIGQSNGETYGFKLVDEYKSILNAGLGVEIYLSDKFSLYSSICSDISAVSSDMRGFVEDHETRKSVFNANLNHYAGGLVMDLDNVDITLGLSYTGTNFKLLKPGVFPDTSGDLFHEQEYVMANLEKWKIVVSFSAIFLKKIEQKAKQKLRID